MIYRAKCVTALMRLRDGMDTAENVWVRSQVGTHEQGKHETADSADRPFEQQLNGVNSNESLRIRRHKRQSVQRQQSFSLVDPSQPDYDVAAPPYDPIADLFKQTAEPVSSKDGASQVNIPLGLLKLYRMIKGVNDTARIDETVGTFRRLMRIQVAKNMCLYGCRIA